MLILLWNPSFIFLVWKVLTCGFPPLEDRDKSIKALSGHDFFGGGILTKEETVSTFNEIVNQVDSDNTLFHCLTLFKSPAAIRFSFTILQLRLVELEKRAVNDMFVILSDIWLDNEEVVHHYLFLHPVSTFHVQLYLIWVSLLSLEKAMAKLHTVMSGFEDVEVVPSLFVFMGNFSSHACNLSFHSYSSIRWGFPGNSS